MVNIVRSVDLFSRKARRCSTIIITPMATKLREFGITASQSGFVYEAVGSFLSDDAVL